MRFFLIQNNYSYYTFDFFPTCNRNECNNNKGIEGKPPGRGATAYMNQKDVEYTDTETEVWV